MIKIVLILCGSISLVIGIIGIVVPGLPTTTFLLITSACYIRSSPKLYNWLINHKLYGRFIRDYHLHRAITLKQKITSLVLMWAAITISSTLFIENKIVIWIVVACGIIGTIVIISVKTLKNKGNC